MPIGLCHLERSESAGQSPRRGRGGQLVGAGCLLPDPPVVEKPYFRVTGPMGPPTGSQCDGNAESTCPLEGKLLIHLKFLGVEMLVYGEILPKCKRNLDTPQPPKTPM